MIMIMNDHQREEYITKDLPYEITQSGRVPSAPALTDFAAAIDDAIKRTKRMTLLM